MIDSYLSGSLPLNILLFWPIVMRSFPMAYVMAKTCVHAPVRPSVTRVISGQMRELIEFIFGRNLSLDNGNHTPEANSIPRAERAVALDAADQ